MERAKRTGDSHPPPQAVSKSTALVSGNAKINPAAIKKKAEFKARAIPNPLRSAIAPTANGAIALNPRPKL